MKEVPAPRKHPVKVLDHDFPPGTSKLVRQTGICYCIINDSSISSLSTAPVSLKPLLLYKFSAWILPFAFNNESIARDISQMKDITEVACASHGILALDSRDEFHYAGRDRNIQEKIKQIHNVKSIAHGVDCFYILTFDGQFLELDQSGVKVKGEKIKFISSDE